MGIRYHIDTLSGEGGRLHAAGWAISEEKRPVTWTLSTKKGGPVQSAKYYPVRRPDISRMYFQTSEYADCGFEIEANMEGERILLLQLADGTETISVPLAPGGAKNRLQQLRGDWLFYRQHRPYQKWLSAERPGKRQLQEQCHFDGPLISVVVPVYRTPLPFLREMVKSVLRQSYGNWQLCISNAGARGGELEHYLRRLAAKDPRIVVAEETGQLGISENTNRALELARGEYLGFMDHDDLLEPDALYEIAVRAVHHPEAMCFYTDEDKMTADGKIFFEPHCKPDFDVHLLQTNNFISHFFVVKSALLRSGGFALREQMDGAQDYDLVLRVTREIRPEQVLHIRKVLYHWRSHPGSTAAAREAKSYTAEAGLRVLLDYWRDSPDVCPQAAAEDGYYRVEVLPPAQMPDVTVVFRGVESLRQIHQLEELAGTWSEGRVEVVLEAPVGLNRRPRGKWLFFAEAAWAENLGESFRAMAAMMQRGRVGAVTGRCVDEKKVIRSAGVHLERRDGRVFAVSSFDGFFEERISYGNLTRLRRQVFGAMPVFLMIERELYEAAGSPVVSRLGARAALEEAAAIGAAAQEAGKEIVYEPGAVAAVSDWPYPAAAALGRECTWKDPYFPELLRQAENGDWAPDPGRERENDA